MVSHLSLGYKLQTLANAGIISFVFNGNTKSQGKLKGLIHARTSILELICTNENARLGRGLVLNDETAARHWMHIRRNFGSGRGNRQSRGSGGLSRAELGKRTERMWEPDRGHESKRGQRSKGEPWRIKITGYQSFSLSDH